MSRRVPPDGLDPLAAAADGYYVVQKSGTRFREWFKLIPGSNVTLTPNAGAHELTIASASATGGGGGGTGKDRRWNVGALETSIDEFNDDTLDAAWVRVDGAGAVAGNLTWTEGADVLSAYNIGGDTADKMHALLRPLSGAGGSMVTGDAFVSCVDLLSPVADFAFCGLVLTDGVTFGAGNQVWCEVATRASGSNLQAFAWTGFNTSGASAGLLTNYGYSLRKVYHRLVMTAANTWRADFSADGISWIKGSATLSKTITPTHVGFFSTSYGTAVKHVASYEFLRRVSGIT